MSDQEIKVVVSENYDGEDLIPNLIETARNLLETDIDQSEDFFAKALILSKNNNYQAGIGECLLELGKIQKNRDNAAASYKLLHQATEFLEKNSDFTKLFECYSLLSDIYFHVGNYTQALESCLLALSISKELNDSILSGKAFNKTGNIYQAIGDYEKAIEYHQQALTIFRDISNKKLISETCYFIGNCYSSLEMFDQAFSFLDESLTIADQVNDPEMQSKPTGSMAVIFTKLKQTDRASDFFYKAIDIVNITGDLKLKADILLNLGQLFSETRQFELALKTLFESLEIAQSIEKHTSLNLIHKAIAETNELAGDFQKALHHYKKYTELTSELITEKVALKSKGIQLKYDFEEARKEKKLADKAIMLKDQFIANISHEIRTPLNGVLGMADLLADTNPTPEQLEYVNTIRLSANNLIYLINDILDFSKMQSGEIDIQYAEFKIRQTIADVSRILKHNIGAKQISLLVRIDEQIPEILIGDAPRLSQILSNIIGNAIKFTEKGEVKLEIKITQAKATDIKLLFIISDTGIGIKEEDIDSIFESFGQLGRDHSKTSGGAGLGLAIVKQLVELQGGSISVNSKGGTGTIFKIELPFRSTLPYSKNAGPVKTNQITSTKEVSEINILLVEDNKVNQFLAQKLLTKMGFGVVIANTGKEAIELLKERTFKIILMDVQMPEMNGYELTEIVRNTLPESVKNIPIIALTAYASLQEKEKALALGMSDYITKPYSPHELLTSIMKQVNLMNQSEQSKAGLTENENIDPAVIRQTSEKLLQLFSGNVNDVLSLLHMLTGQIPVLLNEVDVNIKSKNWPALFQSAHKLKSSVNLVKVNTLINLVSEIEELSRDQIHTERIPGIFESLRKSCDIAVSLLKEETIRLKKTDQPK